MCTFVFCYNNGIKNTFEHIISAKYSLGDGDIVVDENDLLTHGFHTGHDLRLFSNSANFTVSGNNLLYIEIQKED